MTMTGWEIHKAIEPGDKVYLDWSIYNGCGLAREIYPIGGWKQVIEICPCKGDAGGRRCPYPDGTPCKGQIDLGNGAVCWGYENWKVPFKKYVDKDLERFVDWENPDDICPECFGSGTATEVDNYGNPVPIPCPFCRGNNPIKAILRIRRQGAVV